MSLTPRRLALSALAGIVSLTAVACTDPVDHGAIARTGVNLDPQQERINSEINPEVAALVPEEIAEDGALAIGHGKTSSPPLAVTASDNRTMLGVEIDLARNIAQTMGLEPELVPISWDAWPMRLATEDVEIMHSNIGITEERMERFDFATTRAGYLAIDRPTGSDVEVHDYEDISSLRIGLVPGTNQERIMNLWNEQLLAEGQEPAEIYYYSRDTDYILSLLAGHLDVSVSPYPSARFRENTRSDLEVAGRINAGWPDDSLVGSVTQRGNGLAPALAAAVNSMIADGTYQEILETWGISDEAIDLSEVYSLDERTS